MRPMRKVRPPPRPPQPPRWASPNWKPQMLPLHLRPFAPTHYGVRDEQGFFLRPRPRLPPHNRRFATYDISPLVLDLNAEGCDAVRDYNPSRDWEVLQDRWGLDPIIGKWRARIAEVTKRVGEDVRKWVSTETQSGTDSSTTPTTAPWTITELDVVVSALRGLLPNRELDVLGRAPEMDRPDAAESMDMVAEAVSRNGVRLANCRSDEQFLRWIGALFGKDSQKNQKKKAYLDDASFDSFIDQCPSVAAIRRFLGQYPRALEPPNYNGDTRGIDRRISKIADAVVNLNPASAFENILPIICTIQHSLAGVVPEVSARLAPEALVAGAWALDTSSMRQQLIIGQSANLWIETDGRESVGTALQAMARLLLPLEDAMTPALRASVLGFVTGLDESAEKLTPSLRAIAQDSIADTGSDASPFGRYVSLAACLGGWRSVWSAWHAIPPAGDSGDAVTPHLTLFVAAIVQSEAMLRRLDTSRSQIEVAGISENVGLVDCTSWDDAARKDRQAILAGLNELSAPGLEYEDGQGPDQRAKVADPQLSMRIKVALDDRSWMTSMRALQAAIGLVPSPTRSTLAQKNDDVE